MNKRKLRKITRLIPKISHKKGMAPGSLVYVGREIDEPVRIKIMDFDTDNLEEKVIDNVEETADYRDRPTMTWIDFSGIHKIEIIERVGQIFDIHPLVLEDILNTAQRPKSEEIGQHQYTVLKQIHLEEDGMVTTEQVSIVTGKGWIITFQERPEDVFDSVRRRIRETPKRVRTIYPDYLTYALIDAVVDSYFEILELLGERMEEMENELLNSPPNDAMERIHDLKQTLLFIRKSVYPLRETVNMIIRGEFKLFREETILYVRDVSDHLAQVIETVEVIRDTSNGLVDLYLSAGSNRMNEVMKVLTIIATIFIPLSFIAGLYGMNFIYMPELQWRWGYFAALGLMALVAGGMLLYFRRKDWI